MTLNKGVAAGSSRWSRLAYGAVASLVVLLGAAAPSFNRNDVPAPPGVPSADVAVRNDLENARRTLSEVIGTLGPMPSGDSASVAPLDPESPEARDVKRRAARGAEALAQGKPLKAIPDFEAAIAIDPGDPDLLRSLAQAYTQVGNEPRALGIYERLLVLKPDDAQALVATGTAAAAQGQFEDAVRRIAAALAASDAGERKLPPVSRVIADRVMGGALRELELDAAAIECWTRGLASLDELDVLQAAAGNDARQDTTRVRAELLLACADARMRLADPSAALVELKSIVDLPGVNPDVVLPRELLALEQSEQPSDADQRLAAALLRGGLLTEQDVDLAEWLIELSPERPALAEAARRMATERAGELAAAQLLAVVDRQAGIDAFATVLAASPGDAAALRGLMTSRAGDDPKLLAETLVDRLRVAPEYGAVATEAALSTRINERALRSALNALPPSTARSVAIARLAVLGRDLGPAWTLIAEAREQDPNDIGLALVQLAVAGALEEPALVRALERGTSGTPGGLPRHDAITLAVAKAYRSAGDFEAARGRLEKLHDAGVGSARSPLARLLAEMASTMRPDDPARAEMVERAVSIGHETLDSDPTDEDAALVLLRLHDPRTGVAANPETWAALRNRLRNGQLSWLDERVAIEEEISRGRMEPALARLTTLAQGRTHDSELVGLAVSLLARAGRAFDASLWVDRMLERQPALISLRDAKIAAAVQAGSAEELLTTLRSAIESDPEDALAAWHLEAVLRGAGQMEEASERSRARLLARPDGVRRALELANLEQRADRPADALAALDTVLRADDVSGVQRLGAIDIVLRIPSSIPGRSEALMALAEGGLDAADGDAVLYAAAAAMGAVDDARGGSRTEEDEAVERLKELARRAMATDAGASKSMGPSLRWRDAAQMFIDAEMPQTGAEFLRARLDEPTTLEPVPFRALVSAAFASDAAARGRADRAIELLRHLREKGTAPFNWVRAGSESEADALLHLSTLFTLVGDREGSEQILEAALEANRDHPMVLNNRAWARAERGELDERTVDLAERAHAGAPSDAAILDTLGWIRYLKGQLQDDAETGRAGALSLLRRAVEGGSTDPSLEVLDHLGDALWVSGDTEGARRVWGDAVRIGAERFDRNTMLPQLSGYLMGECGVRLVDPEVFYDDHFGRPVQRAARKLADLEAGREPSTQPQLARSASAPTPDQP